MRNYLALTKALKIGSGNSMVGSNSKKYKTYLLYGLIALCLAPTVFLLYQGVYSVLELALQLNQHFSVFCAALFLISMLMFFTGILLMPSLLYFSNDTEFLLALPIKPQTILASKLSVAYLYELPFMFVMSAIVVIPYIQIVQPDIIFYLWLIPLLASIPLVPLLYSSILSILIMRFMPFFKNKDRFNLISGFVVIIFAFGFVSITNQFNYSDINGAETILSLIQSGNNSLVGLLSYLFPNIALAANSFVNSNFLIDLLSIIFCVLLFFIFTTLAKYLYFHGVIGVNEAQSKKKKMSNTSLNKATKKHNIVFSYLIKEIKLLYRSPSYFTNCIAISFIFPIIILISFSFSSTPEDNPFTILESLINNSGDSVWVIIVASGFALGFLANMNNISITSISREGNNIQFVKSIPTSYKNQMLAKIFSGILFSVLFTISMVLAIAYAVPILSPLHYLTIIVSSLFSTVLFNYIALYIDLLHPKLIWDQEITPVKQNFIAFLGVIVSMLLAGTFIGVLFLFNFHNAWIVILISIVICIILTVVLHLNLQKYTTNRLEYVCE